ncbi:MAG: hypothetical protein LBI15_03695 [Dysgonamonadaceae bacterium]|jgi:hypothetical protein|nr:hypothetical protein [Dysgonamonadaceae bacterium]
MKHLLLLFIGTFLCINIAVGQRNVVEMRHSFPATSIQMVEARTSNGSITVTGDANSQATVEVRVSGNNRLSESRIRQLLEENYDIDVRVQNGKLYATARPKRNARNVGNLRQENLSISLIISTPNNVSSDLRTSNGSIGVSNLSGNTVGRTSNGRINLDNSQGNINLTTSNGAISTQNSSGTITLKTSNGRIDLDNLTGVIVAGTSNARITANNIQGTLEVSTSNGAVTLNRLSGNVSASTSNGAVSVEMLSVSEFVRASTSNGNLNLTVPANQGYRLNVSARNRIGTSGLQNFNGNMNERSINGNIGNGGAEINVRGQRVNLNFR